MPIAATGHVLECMEEDRSDNPGAPKCTTSDRTAGTCPLEPEIMEGFWNARPAVLATGALLHTGLFGVRHDVSIAGKFSRLVLEGA